MVQDDVLAITMNNAHSGTEGALNTIFNLVSTDPNDPRPQSLFTSVSVPLTSWVSPKVKAKISANEFIHFGTLSDSSKTKENYCYQCHRQ